MRRFFSMRFCGLVALLALMAFANGVVRADTATFGPVDFSLPKQLHVSKTFGPVVVSKAGKITAKIQWHTRGFLPNDPNIQVRAELIGPNGQVVPGAAKTVVLGHTMKTTILEHQAQASELTGSKQFKVRLRAIDSTNAMDFEGKVTITYPIATLTLPLDVAGKFHLDPGNTQDRSFKLNPNQKGRLEVSSTWVTDLLGGGILNPRPLHVKLFRPDGSLAKQVTMNSALKLTYEVKSGDLDNGNRWRVQIHDPNTQGLDDIAVTVRFTPK